MQKLFSVTIFTFLWIYSNAQKSSILYYLPDSVEVKVNDYISKQKHNPNFYFMLESVNKDTFRVNVCQYQNKEKRRLENWIFLTRRKVVICKSNYPLLLDYDYKFSTLDTLRVGSYGDRANKIVRQLPIAHCFSVKFTKYYILDSADKPIGFANKQKVIE